MLASFSGFITRAGWTLALTAAAASLLSVSPAAQLASRPIEEWRKVLDSPDRVKALKVEDVVARLKLKPTDVVADLGAGTGPFIAPLAKAVPSGTVYAVEVDGGFFPLIDEKVRRAGVTNVRTVLGVYTDPKLPAPVDVAFLHDVLHHISDRPAYLKTLAKYIAPTGRIVVVDYNPAQSPHKDQPELMVSKEQAREMLAATGFKPIEEIALFDDKWFVVFGR
jgi:ubiquinone/menaquinone biosynthesis C-methylase UbiE